MFAHLNLGFSLHHIVLTFLMTAWNCSPVCSYIRWYYNILFNQYRLCTLFFYHSS